jgi:hypothetical protein
MGKRKNKQPSGAAVKREKSTGESSVCEIIQLPLPECVANNITKALEFLTPFIKTQEKDDDIKCPVIIESRTAAFWLPSFRPFADWDLIATPKQVYEMMKDLQAYEDKLKILFNRQPLRRNAIQRRPRTKEITEKTALLPACLYKVSGEIKDMIKFEIEIIPFDDNNSIIKSSSSNQLHDICNGSDNISYLNFPIGKNKGQRCVIAPLEILESLKSSHINWPAYFEKHIADLHSLRALLPPPPPSNNSTVNIGIFADKTKPLTSLYRSTQLEDFLLTRTLETEAFRGTPGAHINLNVSNEDFLGRDVDLFVTRHIPHDDVHELVKYGDILIYDKLKTDSSKAMISKELFSEAPYNSQLKCVKEESMVIALERFLLPQISSDPSHAYKSVVSTHNNSCLIDVIIRTTSVL